MTGGRSACCELIVFGGAGGPRRSRTAAGRAARGPGGRPRQRWLAAAHHDGVHEQVDLVHQPRPERVRRETGAAHAQVAIGGLETANGLRIEVGLERGARRRHVVERARVHDLVHRLPDLGVVLHLRVGTRVIAHGLPDRHRLVHAPAVEGRGGPPLEVVDEGVHLRVRCRPVEAALLVLDEAVERGERRVDELAHELPPGEGATRVVYPTDHRSTPRLLAMITQPVPSAAQSSRPWLGAGAVRWRSAHPIGAGSQESPTHGDDECRLGQQGDGSLTRSVSPCDSRAGGPLPRRQRTCTELRAPYPSSSSPPAPWWVEGSSPPRLPRRESAREGGRPSPAQPAGPADRPPGRPPQGGPGADPLRQGRAERGRRRPARRRQVLRGAVTGTGRVFTILSEFGDAGSGKLGTDPGPLHNQIAEPDRDRGQLDPLGRGLQPGLLRGPVLRRPASRSPTSTRSSRPGNYTVAGAVSDWVKVPGNASTYGDNTVEDFGGAWQFIEDTGNAWYDAQVAAGRSLADIKAELATFDVWDRYDYDADGNFDEPDGYLDHFQAVHAGEGEEAGGGAQGDDAIWSHRWYVNPTDFGLTGPTVGGERGLVRRLPDRRHRLLDRRLHGRARERRPRRVRPRVWPRPRPARPLRHRGRRERHRLLDAHVERLMDEPRR